jgi:hypothetical protein
LYSRGKFYLEKPCRMIKFAMNVSGVEYYNLSTLERMQQPIDLVIMEKRIGYAQKHMIKCKF